MASSYKQDQLSFDLDKWLQLFYYQMRHQMKLISENEKTIVSNQIEGNLSDAALKELRLFASKHSNAVKDTKYLNQLLAPHLLELNKTLEHLLEQNQSRLTPKQKVGRPLKTSVFFMEEVLIALTICKRDKTLTGMVRGRIIEIEGKLKEQFPKINFLIPKNKDTHPGRWASNMEIMIVSGITEDWLNVYGYNKKGFKDYGMIKRYVKEYTLTNSKWPHSLIDYKTTVLATLGYNDKK